MPEPIRMTRAEYEAKYGVAPVIPSAQPIKMTRAEYEAKYGVPPDAPKKKGTLLSPLNEGIEGLKTLYGGGEQGIARKLVKNVQEAASDIQEGDVLKGVAKAGFRTAGDVAGTIYAPVGAAIGATGIGKVYDYIGELSQKGKYNPINLATDSKMIQDFVATHPNLEEDFGRALNLAFAGAEKGTIDPKTVVPRTVAQMQSVATSVKPVLDFKNRAVDTIAKDTAIAKEKLIGVTPKVLKEKVILNTAQKNVTPLMDNSVKALTEVPKTQISGATKTVKDPLALYNEFSKAEELFKVNTHADTAAGIVGQRTGKAFDAVVKTRQNYGKIMGEELRKVGGVKLDATSVVNKHLENLGDSGVVLGKKGLVPTGTQSKFTASEIKQLSTYTKELKKLGKNPSVADIDGFLARTSSDLNLYKAKNNILGTTNAERIIKGSLNDLRTAISSSKVPELSRYVKARSNYSKLSDFLDEGISFLGKKTSSGDYAKDASLVKSSVQSILNGGKKDWLIKLEKLTGYNALDEGVIAFQAMKDAGNFRGQSMLDLLTPKDIPTSTSGAVSRVADFALQKGVDAIVGSPADQTRLVIQNILSQRANATYNTTNPIARGGASTNRIPNNSNSTITPSIQQLSPEVQRLLKMKGKAQ